jgi:hypothetical protein
MADDLRTVLRDAVTASEGLGDIEFVSDVMANMGPDADIIDPSVARLVQTKLPELNLQGYYVPEGFNGTPHSYGGEVFPAEEGTVNVFPNKGNVRTWAHEYRHQQDPDKSHKQVYKEDYLYGQSAAKREEDIEQYKAKYGEYAAERLIKKRDSVMSERQPEPSETLFRPWVYDMLNNLKGETDNFSPRAEMLRDINAYKKGEQ